MNFNRRIGKVGGSKFSQIIIGCYETLLLCIVLSRPGGVGGVDRASSSDVRGSNPLSENNPSLPKAWPFTPRLLEEPGVLLDL